jgi:hypothetical protein
MILICCEAGLAWREEMDLLHSVGVWVVKIKPGHGHEGVNA